MSLTMGGRRHLDASAAASGAAVLAMVGGREGEEADRVGGEEEGRMSGGVEERERNLHMGCAKVWWKFWSGRFRIGGKG